MPRASTAARGTLAPTAGAGSAEERILEGAVRAFAATGYHGTTVPAIAAAAGVSVGLIYRYFTSKAELFLAICARQAEAGIAAKVAQLTAIADPTARLSAAVRVFVSDFATRTWPAVQATAIGEAEQNPRVRQLLRRRSDQVRGAAELLLRDAIRRGDVDTGLPVEPLSLAIAMLLDGAMLTRVTAAEAFDAEEVAVAITTLVGSALGWT